MLLMLGLKKRPYRNGHDVVTLMVDPDGEQGRSWHVRFSPHAK
jgi:hypothetical protein